jgi:hypothetical protein
VFGLGNRPEPNGLKRVLGTKLGRVLLLYGGVEFEGGARYVRGSYYGV